MTAYFNEIDPFACAWLRELMKEGVIADGEIDSRDIRDVRPEELAGFTQCHFFAGIGVWSYALRLAGWPDERPVFTASCPCQPFSASGKRAGFTDERHLWPAFFHLVSQCRPPVLFGEQVASSDGETWLDLVQADLEGEGYRFAPLDLCAAGFGSPNIRQRFFFLADTEAARSSQSRTLKRSERLCSTGSLEHPEIERRGRRENFQDQGRRECSPADRSEAGDLGNAFQPRLEGHSGDERDGNQSGREREDAIGPVAEAGFTNGFWRDAEWIWCRDGKWRPVEPAPLGMADGLAADLGRVRLPGGKAVFFPLIQKGKARVGRLRGYGNAINAEVAAAFIRAYIESCGVSYADTNPA